MRPIECLVCCTLVWPTSPAAAQSVSVADPYKGDYSPKAKQLVLNEGKLNVVLKMDRSQYFTNESATLTIRFANPTSSVLEIRDPSDDRGPALDLMSKDPKWVSMYGSEWGFRSSSPRALFASRHPNPPSVLLAAGEFREQRFRTHEKLKGGTESILSGGVPDYPGDYRLVYSYSLNSRATVDFKVIQPRVLATAVLTSPRTEPYVQFRDKKTIQVKRYTFVFAFEGEGAYWIMTTLFTGATDPRISIDKEGHITYGTKRTDLIRVARSTVPIVAVGGSLDAAENLTITWQDQSGRSFSAELDQDRNPRGKTGSLP